jgi:hypothetical protein
MAFSSIDTRNEARRAALEELKTAVVEMSPTASHMHAKARFRTIQVYPKDLPVPSGAS